MEKNINDDCCKKIRKLHVIITVLILTESLFVGKLHIQVYVQLFNFNIS